MLYNVLALHAFLQTNLKKKRTSMLPHLLTKIIVLGASEDSCAHCNSMKILRMLIVQ